MIWQICNVILSYEKLGRKRPSFKRALAAGFLVLTYPFRLADFVRIA
jgi:hypothetical protein